MHANMPSSRHAHIPGPLRYEVFVVIYLCYLLVFLNPIFACPTSHPWRSPAHILQITTRDKCSTYSKCVGRENPKNSISTTRKILGIHASGNTASSSKEEVHTALFASIAPGGGGGGSQGSGGSGASVSSGILYCFNARSKMKTAGL